MMRSERPSAEPSPAARARHFLRAIDRASLATLMAGAGAPPGGSGAPGAPYASLVLLALAGDGRPILLLSDLAEHSRNIAGDGRASLLIDATGGLDDPLTGARVSLQGRLAKSAEPELRARYLARHPSARQYADFQDFAFYAFAIERAHLVAGFGEIHWIESGALFPPEAVAPALDAAAADIVAHMNQDHADAVGLYAEKLLGQPAGDWRLTGLDAEGCDLRAGGRVARLDFAHPVTEVEDARAELVQLAGQARAQT